MLQAHVLLRGQAFCLIVRSRGEIIALLPLMPDRMKVTQNADLSLNYEYRRKDGGLTVFVQSEIFHLFGLTLDGINGVTPITYARETIGLALAQRDQGALAFRHAARVGGVLEHPQKLGEDARKNLKSSLDEYRAGGESEGKWLILEEGMKPSELQMTPEDAQWIEGRKFSRGDIAMFFGVPPHMIGDTEKSTSWGTGIYEQKDGFVTFTLDDHLTMWEETVTIDLAPTPDIYARFNRSALVKGNLNDRWNAHVKKLQWGVYSPNEIRAQEDDNPREGGDIYYPPPNTAAATRRPIHQSKGFSDDGSQDAGGKDLRAPEEFSMGRAVGRSRQMGRAAACRRVG
jgi:HK97 family phage portal protein